MFNFITGALNQTNQVINLHMLYVTFING